MNLSLQVPVPRNRLWFIESLPLLPLCLVAFAVEGRGDGDALVFGLIRFGLLLFVWSMIRGRWVERLWNVRLAKEFRLQQPGACVALLIPAVLASFPESPVWVVGMAMYPLGCLVIGVSGFAAEFEHRTLGIELARPVERSAVWWDKSFVAGVLLAAACLHQYLWFTWTDERSSLPRALWEPLFYPPLFAWATGPLFGMLSRRVLIGTVMLVATPASLILGFQLVQLLGARLGWDFTGVQPWDTRLVAGYLLCGYVCGRVALNRLQAAETHAAPSAPGVHLLTAFVERILRPFVGRSPVAMLVRKELRLQSAVVLMSILFLIPPAIWMIGPLVAPAEEWTDWDPALLVSVMTILSFVHLLLAGAATVAEERQFGTLEASLVQPLHVRRQWAIKALVAAALWLVLGLAFPTFLLSQILDGATWATYNRGLPLLAALGLGILFPVSLFASSVSRTTLSAAVRTLLLAILLLSVPWWASHWMFSVFEGVQWDLAAGWSMVAELVPGFHEEYRRRVDSSTGILLLLIAVLYALFWVGSILWLARRNAGKLAVPVRLVIWQVVGLSLAHAALTLGGIAAVSAQLLPYRERAEPFAGPSGWPPAVVLPGTVGGALTNPPVAPVPLSPEMARRYGLIPRSPRQPPPPAPAPERR